MRLYYSTRLDIPIVVARILEYQWPLVYFGLFPKLDVVLEVCFV